MDGNGALDFLEFLVLMRRCDDIRDEGDARKPISSHSQTEKEGHRRRYKARWTTLHKLKQAKVKETDVDRPSIGFIMRLCMYGESSIVGRRGWSWTKQREMAEAT